MKQASGGIILAADTKRILFQLRKPDKRDQSFWGFFGGVLDPGETPFEGLKRELIEEVGVIPNIIKYYPFHKMVSNSDTFEYYTYVVSVQSEFVPELNYESGGYAWVNFETPPKPLHSGSKLIMYNPQLLGKLHTIIQNSVN